MSMMWLNAALAIIKLNEFHLGKGWCLVCLLPKGYVGLVVVFLLESLLPLGMSGRHASRHTIINLMGRSNSYCLN
jgi:hypothetical protein